jgi:hypothetical protein
VIAGDVDGVYYYYFYWMASKQNKKNAFLGGPHLFLTALIQGD